MGAPIEHKDFSILALYLVTGFVVCEARTITDGWSDHGSPPRLEEMESGAIRSQWGMALPYTFPQTERRRIDA
jgi:hypothetical protein